MAIKKRSSFWSSMHFLLRFLGLNGLVAIAVGVIIWQMLDDAEVKNYTGLGATELGMYVIVGGLCAIALALLGEVRGLVQATFSNRGFAGVNGLFQIAMAAFLFGAGNWYAFNHYQRIDTTRDGAFTLPSNVRSQLADLRGDTDIIIYLQHVSFGQRVDLRQDAYDQAAEKVIVGKVKDLAEQFQELGPQFRVKILDTQKKDAEKRKDDIKKISPELADAIEKAPEDSIFLYSQDSKQIQRLSFNDIFQLDKKASMEANNKKGNLVLNYQGVQNFADKVFKIEEKKPRIGFAVVHGFLGQDGTEDIGMPGLKDALTKRGYDGRDIVLRKWPARDPAALESEESKFEMLEAKKSFLERDIKDWSDEMIDDKKERDFWANSKIDEINKQFVIVRTQFGFSMVSRKEVEAFRKATGKEPLTRDITEEMRVERAKELAADYESYEQELVTKQKKLAKVVEEQSTLRVDNLAEQRRMTDVREKMKRLLADVDLLVVPRATIFNLLRRDQISQRVYVLEDSHILGIKDFMKAGKPVLFLLGPANEAGGPADREGDELEKMLAEFNIELPNQTILYNAEAEAMAEAEEREMNAGRVDVPPVEFDWRLAAGSKLFSGLDINAASPIRNSMRLTANSFGEKSREGLKIRHWRPVYAVNKSWKGEAVGGAVGLLASPDTATQGLVMLLEGSEKKIDEKSVIMMSPPDAWNEEKPFPEGRYIPKFKRVKSDDPTKGTLLERRRGPFPIGVAVETTVPAEWYEKDAPKSPAKIRLGVIGHGGLFIGEKLPPMREKLFLDTTNWLLGRDNLLARDNETWEYPRIELSARNKQLWMIGVCYALPLLFLYIGVCVGLVRQMR